jgi:hypothetical protein
MVSPEHVDEQKPEDQQPLDPAEEKQVLSVGEKKRTWLEPLLRVIAIVVSVIGGFAAMYLMVLSYRPWLELGIENSSYDQLWYLRYLALLLVGLVALGGAVLFRSWWAILFVPLAIGLGVVLALYLSNQIVPELVSYDDVSFDIAINLILTALSALIGACIGTSIIKVWKNE